MAQQLREPDTTARTGQPRRRRPSAKVVAAVAAVAVALPVGAQVTVTFDDRP